MANSDPDCLFCKIVAGDIPADMVYTTDTVVAFRDIEPQAPTHVLVIPRSHHADVVSLAAAEPDTAVDLLKAIAEVVAKESLDKGHRVVFNTGRDGNQLVPHVHAHVLGGRSLGWPPG